MFPLTYPLDIVLVSALDVPRPPLTSPGPTARRLYGGAIAGLRRDAQQGAEAVTEALHAALRPRAASMAVRIVDGRPTPAILDIARSWNANLIMVGGSGRGAWGRTILGSVSDDVVRAAPCPVLMAKRRVVRFDRMLVATDGSLYAEAALRFVAGLPVPPTAELRVCSVSETPDGLLRPRLPGRPAAVTESRWEGSRTISPVHPRVNPPSLPERQRGESSALAPRASVAPDQSSGGSRGRSLAWRAISLIGSDR